MSQALARYSGARPSQRAAGYIGGGGRERCAECRFFMPASTCTRIEGPVSARGWCRYYSRELAVLRYTPQGAIGGGGVPAGQTLDLSFMAGSIDPSLTFTRGSVATYFDATGVMQTAAMNMVPNGSAVGAVVGTPGTLPTGWVHSENSNIVPAVAGFGSESGIPYVDLRFVGTTTGTANNVYMANGSITAGNSQAWAASVYLRLVGGSMPAANIVNILGSDNVGPHYTAGFNPTTAPLASQRYVNTFTTNSSGVTSVSMLVQMTVPATTAIDFTLRIGAAQTELGATATPYIPTTSVPSGAPRFDYNPVTHAALGLLIEEQRTNVLVGSGGLAWAVNAAIITPNSGTAPDNTTTMSRFSEQASTNQHFAWVDTAGLTASTTYVFSVFARTQQSQWLQLSLNDTTYVNGGHATFDLLAGTISGPLTARGTGVIGTAAIQAMGGGTYRCSIATTVGAFTTGRTVLSLSNAANPGFAPNYAGNAANGLLVWGAQLEVGAFPTSYVATTAAAVTRSSDVLQIPPANTGWFVSPGGSWMAELIPLALIANYQRIIYQGTSPGNLGPVVFDNATPAHGGQYDGTALFFTTNTTIAGAVAKIATTAIASAAGTVCMNGGAVASGTMSAAYPTIASGGLGFMCGTGVNGNSQMGWLRRVRYWPRILSNAELQSVTT